MGEMSPSIRSSNTICLFLFLCATVICQDVEHTSEIPQDFEDESESIWMEYEFGTGAGNREGIKYCSIRFRKYSKLKKKKKENF